MNFHLKKTSYSSKTLRMPDDLIEKIYALANKEGMSFNKVVIQCCEFAIENFHDYDIEIKKEKSEY